MRRFLLLFIKWFRERAINKPFNMRKSLKLDKIIKKLED